MTTKPESNFEMDPNDQCVYQNLLEASAPTTLLIVSNPFTIT